MSALNLSRVAFGCASLDDLVRRMKERELDGEVRLTTRNGPKRVAELNGGSLYWIIKHQLVARSPLIGFERDEETRRTSIILDPALAIVQPWGRRAHQGWRYLEAADAPPDLEALGAGVTLPEGLRGELVDLALI
jgi:hypothetical protein